MFSKYLWRYSCIMKSTGIALLLIWYLNFSFQHVILTRRLYVSIVRTCVWKCTVIFFLNILRGLTVVLGALAKYNYEAPGGGASTLLRRHWFHFSRNQEKHSDSATSASPPSWNLSELIMYFMSKLGLYSNCQIWWSYLEPRSSRPTKSPASRGRLPHFGAISRSPAASLKSPASPALNLVSWFSAKWLKLLPPDVIF